MKTKAEARLRFASMAGIAVAWLKDENVDEARRALKLANALLQVYERIPTNGVKS